MRNKRVSSRIGFPSVSKILEIVALWFSRVARLVVAHVAQAGVFRHFDRVGDDLDLRDFLFLGLDFFGVFERRCPQKNK